STPRNGCRGAPSPTNCIVAHTPFMMPRLQPVPSLHFCCTRFATPPAKSTRKEGHMHRFLLVVAAGLLVSCRDAAHPTVPAEVAATPAASAPYTFLDLGSLEGYTEAAAINDAGQVVGRSATASGELRAFRWTDGTMEDIGPNAGIAPVLKRFLAHYWGRHRDPTTPVPSISKGTLWALGAHAWPANVREL